MPVLKLGAFFAAVVVASNSLLAAVYTAPPGQPESATPSGYLDRKVKRVRRAIERVRVKLLEEFTRPESAAPSSIVYCAALLPTPVLQGGQEDETLAVGPARLTRPMPMLASSAGGELDPALYLHVMTEPALLWLEPAPAVAAPRFAVGCGAGEWLEHRAIPLTAFAQVSENDFYASALRVEFLENWERATRSETNIVTGVMDGVFGFPRTLTDEVAGWVRWCFPPSGEYSLVEEDKAAMVMRMLGSREAVETKEPPFRAFLTRWVEREQRHFSGHAEYLLTFGVQEGWEDVDQGDFEYEQRKIFWDVMRKTYLSKHLPRVEERLKDEAWRFSEWRTLDFVVAPPMLAAYTWYRGWERRVSFLGTRLRVRIEPIYKIKQVWDDDGEHLVTAVGLEWEIPGFPVKLLVSAGLRDGDPEMDFVGIGTSIGMAKSAVVQYMSEEESEDD